jgi:dTDP-4-amino-4,6-dideoxygalactose transaminase
MKVPLAKPYITDAEFSSVKSVLESGQLYHGPIGEQFEKRFARYIGTEHAVCLNSGTSALFLAIKSLRKKGDIIVPSFTYVATINAIITSSCRPVFCDIGPCTFNLDPALIEEKITRQTIAILPVHFAGLSCDMKPIAEICERHGLNLIEDSAHAIGAQFQGKKTGSFGTGCFSFDPLKNMTTGEGGMLTTDDASIATYARLLRSQGINRTVGTFPWHRESVVAGYSLGMPEASAALGLVQLSRLDEMNALRRRNAEYYAKRLEHEELELPLRSDSHTYQMFNIKVGRAIDRNKFVMHLRNHGVEASVHFDPPVHMMKIIKQKATLPVTEDVAGRIVTLPMYPQLATEEMDFVTEKVKEGLRLCRLP